MVRDDRLVSTLQARIELVDREVLDLVAPDVVDNPEAADVSGGAQVAERVLADGKPWRVVAVTGGMTIRVVSGDRIEKVEAR